MKHKALLIIYSLFLFGTALGQEADSTGYYARYQGELMNKKTVANVLHNRNTIEGWLWSEDSQYTGLISGMSSGGDTISALTIGDGLTLTITSFDPEQMAGEASFSSSEPIPFSLTASYPDGSTPLSVAYLHSELMLNPQLEDSPTATIELTFLYPSPSADSSAVATLYQLITEKFFSTQSDGQPADSLLAHYEQEYYQSYNEKNKPLLDNGGHAFSWEKYQTMGVLYNQNSLLCLEYQQYVYSGGAHGMSHSSYQILNTGNHTLLNYEDIFLPGSDSLLTIMLTAELISSQQLNPGTPLKEQGFFVNEITPNHHVFINGDGVGFVYNPYEIAPYVRGITEVFLPYNRVQNLLNPETPVYGISTN